MGRLVTTILIVSQLFSGYSYADEDHNEAYELLRSGEVLSLEYILQITRQKIQGEILKVELEHDDGQLIYELEVLDEKGIVWEFKVDAKSGIIIKQEQD